MLTKPFTNIRGRPEQLNLQDDPAFIPDFNIDLDLSLFNIPFELSSSRASSQLPSLAGLSHGSLSDQEPQLELPSEDTPGLGSGGFDFGAGTSSVGQWGNKIRASSIFEEPGIIDDPDLVIDEDGNVYTPTQRRQQSEVAQEALASLGIPGSKAGDSTGITDRVRADHEAGLQDDIYDQAFDFDDQPMFMADDDLPLPDAAPFSARQSSPAPPDGQPRQSSSAHPHQEASSVVEVAPQRRTRAKPPIKVDVETQIPSRDLKAWDDNYVRNMAEVRMEHAYITSTLSQSKKNAEHLVLGIGLSGLGREFDTDLEHPLRQAFSGKAFFDTLTGKETSPAGKKRSRSPDEDEAEDENGRRVRPRSDDDQEVARGEDNQFQFDDNDGMFVQGDDDVVSISSPFPLHN
jgi:meiotic recombination protein REC8, fungi type